VFQFRALTADLRVPPAEKLQLGGNIISASAKLLYGFLWQEAYIRPPFVDDPAANAIGAELIPLVNSFANRFNNFTYYEQNLQVRISRSNFFRDVSSKLTFQDGYRIYPGDERCNREINHSKWHLMSGVGLLDLVYVCENVLRLTTSLAN